MTLGPKKLLKCLDDSLMAKAVTTGKVSVYMKLASSSSSSTLYEHVQSGLHQMLLIQYSERNDPFDGISPQHRSTN